MSCTNIFCNKGVVQRKRLKVEYSINAYSIVRHYLYFKRLQVTTAHTVSADPLAGSEWRIDGCLHLTAFLRHGIRVIKI